MRFDDLIRSFTAFCAIINDNFCPIWQHSLANGTRLDKQLDDDYNAREYITEGELYT